MHALILLAVAAPAPFVRPAPPPPAIKAGAYSMLWSGTVCETHFHADGSYACNWHGTWWHGRWKQEKGTLAVDEWPQDSPDRLHRWTVGLSGDAVGKMGPHEWSLGTISGPVR